MINQLIAKYLTGFRAASVLDVGPGYADFGLNAARLVGAQCITWLDCDPTVLQFQSEAGARLNLRVVTVLSSLESADLSAITGGYDLILCQEVLEHLPNAEEALCRLSSQLTPSGRIVITVPTKRSERWIKLLNPSYMKNEPHGHVNEFDESGLRGLLAASKLRALVFLPIQPHYFVSHTWFFGTRMKVEGSTGKILTTGVRRYVFSWLTRNCSRLFSATGVEMWGRLLPRNYFVLACRDACHD